MEKPEDLLGFDTPESSEFALTKSDQKPPYVRGDRFQIEDWADPAKMIKFINNMRAVPLDAVDNKIVHDSYTAAVWYFRKAAIEGDLKATSAMEKWLAWAKPIIAQAKAPVETKPSKGSVAFMPREPVSGEE